MLRGQKKLDKWLILYKKINDKKKSNIKHTPKEKTSLKKVSKIIVYPLDPRIFRTWNKHRLIKLYWMRQKKKNRSYEIYIGPPGTARKARFYLKKIVSKQYPMSFSYKRYKQKYKQK